MKVSVSAANIKKIDKFGMLDLLMDFPSQCGQARDIASAGRVYFEKKDFTKIVFVGLGASAIGADILKSYLYFKSRVPINVYREYELPAYVDGSTLVFILSYSGNTEETINAYRQAKENGASLVLISSDGAIKEFALKDKLAFVEVPQGLPPRCALGYLGIVPLVLLHKLGFCDDPSPYIAETVRTLEELRDANLGPRIGKKDNAARHIADKLFGKIPVIYSSSVHFDAVVTRWRTQVNENSKALALTHLFPEMNHNEIMGWQNPQRLLKNLIVVMLRDKGMYKRVSTRMDITKDIIREQGVDVLEVASRGEGLLSRIFSLIYTGDFVSFYLAILYGVDPTPVDRITYLKKRLAQSK